MDDLISRQDVIDLISINKEQEIKRSISADCKHKSVVRSKHDSNVAFCEYLIKYVEDIPPAEPKQGRWVETIVRGSTALYCSNCEQDSGYFYRYNYCPNCGAKMNIT